MTGVLEVFADWPTTTQLLVSAASAGAVASAVFRLRQARRWRPPARRWGVDQVQTVGKGSVGIQAGGNVIFQGGFTDWTSPPAPEVVRRGRAAIAAADAEVTATWCAGCDRVDVNEADMAFTPDGLYRCTTCVPLESALPTHRVFSVKSGVVTQTYAPCDCRPDERCDRCQVVPGSLTDQVLADGPAMTSTTQVRRANDMDVRPDTPPCHCSMARSRRIPSSWCPRHGDDVDGGPWRDWQAR